MNILFVMYDQLRFDYLSCAGHPTLHTPHFDVDESALKTGAGLMAYAAATVNR